MGSSIIGVIVLLSKSHFHLVFQKLSSWNGAFAALKDDGSVVTWGNNDFGGDSSLVSEQLSSGVLKIISNQMAFAVLKNDGSVITWGQQEFGGDSSLVQESLSSGVSEIYSTVGGAFAVIKEDGSVVT